MIVWRGWGILVVLVAGALAGGGTFLGTVLGADPQKANLGTVLGLLLAGVAVWFLGVRMNVPPADRPGAPRNQHTLFFVPMQFWGPLLAVGAVAATVVMITG
ncbi:hypothetical protein ACFOWE_07490 [Planomonospora corallina]|uniref:Uncharacterized protein n=1 Tax=Planomonospora corallina TaxID=1806052 RepID=A0ABV8I4Y0_9ACTN